MGLKKKCDGNEDEIKLLKEVKFEKGSYLDKARDLFLLSIYSGLRYSDFINIKPENIVDIDGKQFLNVFTQKTGEEVYIPIKLELKEILEKHGNRSPEPISPQKLNEYIKEVCKGAEIITPIIHQINENGKTKQLTKLKYELITAHTGRRTWASINYAKGYRVSRLMQVTGHATEAQFLEYVNADKKRLAIDLYEEMERNEGPKLRIAK